MNTTYSVPYSENYFSKIFLDYVGSHKNLAPFIQYEPSLSSIAKAFENKSKENIHIEFNELSEDRIAKLERNVNNLMSKMDKIIQLLENK